MDSRLPSWICFDTPTPTRAIARKTEFSASPSNGYVRGNSNGDDSSPRRVSNLDRVMQHTTCSRMKPPPIVQQHAPLSPRRKTREANSKEEHQRKLHQRSPKQAVDGAQKSPVFPSLSTGETRQDTDEVDHIGAKEVTNIERCPEFWKMCAQSTVSSASSSTWPYKKTLLVSLCQQGLWAEAFNRCKSHPQEAIPVPVAPSSDARLQVQEDQEDQVMLFQPTALGAVCNVNTSFLAPNTDKKSVREDEENDNDVLFALIKALLHACPEQVQCSQSISGHTPLRDALRNPTINPKVLELLLVADSSLSKSATKHNDCEMSTFPPLSLDSAVGQQDRDGLYPLDHAIFGVVHEQKSSRPTTPTTSGDSTADGFSSHSLQMLTTFLRHASPHCFTNEQDDISSDVGICKIATMAGSRARSSPLVRLFSCGNSISACNGSSSRHDRANVKKKATRMVVDQNEPEDPRVARILECTRLLLRANPSLVYVNSPATNCSPLHVALRNYGNVLQLIRELMDADDRNTVMRHRNHYGDLPLHVASSCGVPMNVLRLVLAKTVAASSSSLSPMVSPVAASKQAQHGVSGESSFDSLIWSTNHAGYTPVDLEWIRHIEAGNGFFSHRAFYPLDPRGVQRPRGRYDDLYDSLLRKAVDQVLMQSGSARATASSQYDTQRSLPSTSAPLSTDGGGVDRQVESDQVFGLLLHRIFLISRAAFHDSFSRSPFDLSGDILHQSSALCLPHGPSLPLPILELILNHYPQQASQRDHLGKLPLHHAVQVPGGRLSASSLCSSCPVLPSDRKGNAWLQWIRTLLSRTPDVACVRDARGRLPLHCALDASSTSDDGQTPSPATSNSIVSPETHTTLVPQVDDMLKELVGHNPEAVEVRDPATGLFPFMLAASNPLVSFDMTYMLFRRSTTTFAIHSTTDT